jgi:hypothetical protein
VRLVLPARFRGVRVVGDVHGEAAAFHAAIAGATAADLFVVQLGDLTDHGPDSPGVLEAMFALIDSGSGLFLLGNHDRKLRRALLGKAAPGPHDGLERTLAQLAAHPSGGRLSLRAVEEIARAPAWVAWGDRGLFVHAAFHPEMLRRPPPPDAGERRPNAAVSRALYGQTVRGALSPSGHPVRLLDWVDEIPRGFTVWCGHDCRSGDGRPHICEGRAGGRAVFLDTGAGKGGHLSWVDLAGEDGKGG